MMDGFIITFVFEVTSSNNMCESLSVCAIDKPGKGLPKSPNSFFMHFLCEDTHFRKTSQHFILGTRLNDGGNGSQ
jgi:hypothetical protein